MVPSRGQALSLQPFPRARSPTGQPGAAGLGDERLSSPLNQAILEDLSHSPLSH